jgi:alpha-mannosidase
MSSSETILKTIARLSQLVKTPLQNTWGIPLNDKGYITWEKGKKVKEISQKLIIPEHLQGYPLQGLAVKIGLAWWAEKAEIYVNGYLKQEGDLFDSSTRILLSPSAQAEEEIDISLRLVSPQHDSGALMQSYLVYESLDDLDPQFVADELTILHDYFLAFNPERLKDLEIALNIINWQDLNKQEAFNNSLNKLRQNLLPYSEDIKQRKFHLLGHAHLDMAWLWPLAETWQVAENTFNSVLNLQTEFPELTFAHSSPIIYAWLEKNRPEVFEKIQAAIKSKSWEIFGGMWVEPEVNLISGESLVRQLLYGQKYIEEKFGKITRVAWLPDSFGFPWQLPQILKQSGIDYFVTGKLHWNDTTKFPHGVFWWRSPDETGILTLMSPPNVAGVMDTNPITMTNYAVAWEKQTGLQDIFWLPGVGDHGGGPSRDMLVTQRRWGKSPFFPQINFTTAQAYLETIASPDLPVWKDELYLEFHRGCYTSHAEQKYFNRRCEGLLYQAELWAALASIKLGIAYPAQEIETAWKKVLLNQFHDILPGTSIPEVFRDANQDWQIALEMGRKILSNSLQALAGEIYLDNPPHPNAQILVVFNSLNWRRSQVIELSLNPREWQVFSYNGKSLDTQASAEGTLLFFAEDIPSVGYKAYWLVSLKSDIKALKLPQEFCLENKHLKVIINKQTGEIKSIFDKLHNREILAGAGNQLQAFRDQGQYWDAWNIDPNYSQYPLEESRLIAIEYRENGNLRQSIRVSKELGKSLFYQDYILEVNSPLLKIVTQVDWQEEHVLVKAAFPLQVDNDYTTYEISYGAIQREHQDPVKWEVYARHWADLSDRTGNYGVSLLNDSKYGYDGQNQQLRLTLLRRPTWPDPQADLGEHHFTYALYPHAGTWEQAQTLYRGYELNIPLETVIIEPFSSPPPNAQLPEASWLDLGAANLILSTLKRSETDPEAWILRFYEGLGQESAVQLRSELDLELGQSVDLLERPTAGGLGIKPWQIRSFSLRAHQKDHLTAPLGVQKPYRRQNQ